MTLFSTRLGRKTKAKEAEGKIAKIPRNDLKVPNFDVCNDLTQTSITHYSSKIGYTYSTSMTTTLYPLVKFGKLLAKSSYFIIFHFRHAENIKIWQNVLMVPPTKYTHIRRKVIGSILIRFFRQPFIKQNRHNTTSFRRPFWSSYFDSKLHSSQAASN